MYVLVPKGTIDEVIADHERDLIPSVARVGTIFPATHLGDPHQLIVFYEDDLPIHVDFQYKEPQELVPRNKDQHVAILLDPTGILSRWLGECRQVPAEEVRAQAQALQYIEDRFWGWCWYAYSKIERGELWEARDAIEYIRKHVVVVIASIVLGLLDEGNRRLEWKFPPDLLAQLERSVPDSHAKESYGNALRSLIAMYRSLFSALPRDLQKEVILVDRDYFSRSLNLGT